MWNLDSIIFLSFLAINLFVGLFYSRSIKNITDYAVGDRNFSTGILATTIIATYIGGDLFFLDLPKTYQDGLSYIFINFGGTLAFFIVAFWLAPRMSEFLGMLSIAEAMGKLFGKKARIITAICSIGINIGAVAMEFQVASIIISYLFDISSIYATIISGIVVIIYSARGGIKAVTFTDIIQFFTFGTFIPVLALLIWGTLENPEAILQTLKTTPNFDYKVVFSYNNPRFWNLMTLFLLFAMPQCFDPPMFQRVSMARNTKQVARSFFIAGLLSIIICCFIDWIAILLLSTKKDIPADNIIIYIIEKFSYPGFKSFIVVGITSTLMSTADSYINSSAVLFAHDICQPMKIKWVNKNELLLSRLSTIFIGTIAILIALWSNSLFDLLILINNFYVPIIVAPLLLAILGFRSSETAVLIGMMAGVLSTLLWNTMLPNIDIESAIPGFLANIIFLIGSHYLLKQPGGFVGIKDPTPLIIIREERKRKFQQLLYSIKNFNILSFFKSNLPKRNSVFTCFGFFIIASTYSSLYTIPEALRIQYINIYQYIYHSVLIMSTIFLTYPLWPPKFRNENFIAIVWNIGIFYLLIVVGGLLVIISGSNQLQLMICLLNFIITSLLLSRWQVTLLFIIAGTFSATQIFKLCVNQSILPGYLGDMQFQIIYILLLFSSALMVFVRPKQTQEQMSEFSNKRLHEKIENQQQELIKSLQHNAEFFKNLDEGCIEKFKSINSEISDLNMQLKNTQDPTKIKHIAEQLMLTTERLESGAGYLSEAMYDLQNIIQIKVNTVDLSQIINCVLQRYECFNWEINFITNIKTKYQNIDCDQILITSALNNLIDCIIATNQSKDEEITINIIIEDEKLTFPLSFIHEYIKKIDGVKFSIIVDIPQTERNIQNVNFDDVTNIMVTRLQKIITSHYGTFNTCSNATKIIYSFTIPVKINDIRPKRI